MSNLLPKSRKRAVLRYKQRLQRSGFLCCEVCGWSPPRGLFDKHNMGIRHGEMSRVSGVCAHHIIPIACGGTEKEENLVALCPNHHAICHMVNPQRNGTYLGRRKKADLIAELRAIDAGESYLVHFHDQEMREAVDVVADYFEA